MKLKKILAVFLACCLSLSFLMIPVSASAPLNLERNTIRFISELSNNFNDYKSGSLSLSEFFESVGISVARYNINFYSDATSFRKLLKELENIGIPVSDSWLDWYYQKMGGDGGGGHRDDSILDGYGAVLRFDSLISLHPDAHFLAFVYCEYATVEIFVDTQGNTIRKYKTYGDNRKMVLTNGDVKYSGFSAYDDYLSRNTDNISAFGDIRKLESGELAEDVITPFPEEVPPNYDDEEVPEDDLEDFLDDLLEELQNENPDTSTIEGLLRSILSKLDSLDKDDDTALLSEILTAIQALKIEQGKEEENEPTESPSEDPIEEPLDLSELLDILQELRDSLIYEDAETTATTAELLHEILENQITTEDFEIDESLFNQRFALIQAKLLGKFSFISETKDFIEYALDSYANTSSRPSISVTLFGSSHSLDFSAFDEHIDLIRFCVAAFFYLSFAFSIFRKIPGYINGGDNT